MPCTPFLRILALAAASPLSRPAAAARSRPRRGTCASSTRAAASARSTCSPTTTRSSPGSRPLTASGYADLKNEHLFARRAPERQRRHAGDDEHRPPRKQHQTVVAYTSGGTTAATVLSDEEGDPGSGKAKLRVFNTAAADAGNVDVYLISAACSTLATSAAAPVASNVSGLQDAYTEVASGGDGLPRLRDRRATRPTCGSSIPSLVSQRKADRHAHPRARRRRRAAERIVLDQQGAATQALNASARVRVAASVAPARAGQRRRQRHDVAAGLTAPDVGGVRHGARRRISVKVERHVGDAGAPLTAAPGADVTLLLTGSTPTVTLLADDNTASTSSAKPVKLRLVNGLNGTTGVGDAHAQQRRRRQRRRTRASPPATRRWRRAPGSPGSRRRPASCSTTSTRRPR